jgi:hypothetical protein
VVKSELNFDTVLCEHTIGILCRSEEISLHNHHKAHKNGPDESLYANMLLAGGSRGHHHDFKLNFILSLYHGEGSQSI